MVGLVLVFVCISMAIGVWNVVEVRKVSSGLNSVKDGVNVNVTVAIDSLKSQLQDVAGAIAAIQSHLAGQFPSLPASSCLQVSLINSSSLSGYYWVKASNSSAVHVYCDMTRSCGGVTGGWTRVAYLQFENGSGLVLMASGNTVILAYVPVGSTGCSSILFDTFGHPI